MEKNFKNIASLHAKAARIRRIAYQILETAKEIDDMSVKDMLQDVGDKLAEQSEKQKSALRRKFFTDFTPTTEELKALRERYPKAAPATNSYQRISVPRFCKWLAENPEMLDSQRNKFLRLDYAVFKTWYDSVKECKQLLLRLITVKSEIIRKRAHQLYRIIYMEELLLIIRFAINFPSTYEATFLYPNFSFALFYELLKENPQLMVANENAFSCYILNMEACNRPVPRELLNIFIRAACA